MQRFIILGSKRSIRHIIFLFIFEMKIEKFFVFLNFGLAYVRDLVRCGSFIILYNLIFLFFFYFSPNLQRFQMMEIQETLEHS